MHFVTISNKEIVFWYRSQFIDVFAFKFNFILNPQDKNIIVTKYDPFLDHLIILRYNTIEFYSTINPDSTSLKAKCNENFINLRIYAIPISN